MKTNEQQLEELYANFPESEDKDEVLCDLITDSIAAIGYWNTKEPEPEDKTRDTGKTGFGKMSRLARPWSSVTRTTMANSISPI